MKKKVKKFADGNVVRTRTDDEIAEDNKNPYGRYTPKTKSYSLDDVKSGISRLFGGKSDSTEKSTSSEDRPKSDGVQDYASLGKRFGSMPAKSTWDGSPNIKEEPKEEPTRKISDYINKDVTTTDEKAVEREVMDVKPEKKAARKVEPKKAIGEDVKTAPAKPPTKKEEPNPLPGRQGDVKPKPLAFKQEEAPAGKYDDVTSKKDLGSQGSFKMNTNKPVTRYKKQEESAPEVKVPKSKMDVEPEDMPKAASKAMKDDTQYKTKYGDFSFQKGFKKDEDKKEKKTRSTADIRAGRYATGGSVSSASSRGDGIAQRGKTRGRIY